MKMILRSALAVAAMAGAAVMITAPASAASMAVAVGVGAPNRAVVVASPNCPGYVAYDDEYYYEPIYISGSWYHGPYHWRMRNGERQFLVNGRWRLNEWRDSTYPTTIVFRNGGRYGAGRYEGFAGADRINARFRMNKPDMRDDRQDERHDGQRNNEDHEHHDGGNSRN